jgi:hypothetical protein
MRERIVHPAPYGPELPTFKLSTPWGGATFRPADTRIITHSDFPDMTYVEHTERDGQVRRIQHDEMIRGGMSCLYVLEYPMEVVQGEPRPEDIRRYDEAFLKRLRITPMMFDEILS